MISRSEYEQLAEQGYTHIPLVRELPADLDTPVGVYLKLANNPNSYLLESASEGRYWGRYSIIGTNCENYICVDDFTVSLYEEGCLSSQDKIKQARKFLDRHAAEVWLEVDGGIKVENIAKVKAAGADTFVAGSAIFGSDNYRHTITDMRDRINNAAKSS